MWSQTALARRSLTGPALHGDYVVVGDYKGYVHWLQASDGAMAARARVAVTPCWPSRMSQTVLLVQNVDGKLTAFRLANYTEYSRCCLWSPWFEVGKSTIFNVDPHRDALVHDQPGVTCDRNYGLPPRRGQSFRRGIPRYCR